MSKIYFHGTKRKATADMIMKKGFKENTWFADHLEDALEFGGKYVFEVAIDIGNSRRVYNWQFCLADSLPPESIVCFRKIENKVIFNNKELRKKIFASHNKN